MWPPPPFSTRERGFLFIFRQTRRYIAPRSWSRLRDAKVAIPDSSICRSGNRNRADRPDQRNLGGCCGLRYSLYCWSESADRSDEHDAKGEKNSALGMMRTRSVLLSSAREKPGFIGAPFHRTIPFLPLSCREKVVSARMHFEVTRLPNGNCRHRRHRHTANRVLRIMQSSPANKPEHKKNQDRQCQPCEPIAK